jgi:NTE family protein
LGGARFKFTLDQVDNVFFPTKGNLTRLNLYLSREGLGAGDEYDRMTFTTAQAWTRGRNTFVGRLMVGTDFNSDLPFYDQFKLGGFMNLSGLERGRLRGNVKGLAALVDYWAIGSLGALGRLYLGGAVEAGNVWVDVHAVDTGDLLYSGSLFFGLDSKLLPVYLGYGHTDSGEDSWFLFIGRAFGRD